MRIELELTPEQEEQLTRIARLEGIQPEEMLQAAAIRMLREDEKHLAAIQRGLEQADRGELIDHEVVVARIEQRFLTK